MQPEDLIREAAAARKNAHAPYSHYQVGAALLTTTGQVYRGVNVENASYGLTICAERAAICQAITAGQHDFQALAVVTDQGASMCGACRQVAHEFAPNMTVYLADASGKYTTTTVAALLPGAFASDSLK